MSTPDPAKAEKTDAPLADPSEDSPGIGTLKVPKPLSNFAR